MAAESFLPLFDQRFFPLLGGRAGTFRAMFELLERKSHRDYLIVETGCVRQAGNWAGDGQSTILFDQFVNFHSGSVFSVDLDPKATQAAVPLVTPKTSLCCGDSLKFIWQFNPGRKIDLLYLDSFDLDIQNPHPSAMHHIKELCAAFARGHIGPGTIIAVDDNPPNSPGKGAYVAEFFANIGIAPVFRGYQIGWVL